MPTLPVDADEWLIGRHLLALVVVDGSLHTRAGVNDLAILSDALVQSLASVQRTTTLQTRAEHQLGIVIAHAAKTARHQQRSGPCAT